MSAALKQFQKNTVGAALAGLKREQGPRRFLVADEVGLGKTMVARGVIAALLKEGRGSLRVFYLASGGRIGSQNAGRLKPEGENGPSAVDRLGMMHQQNRIHRNGLQLFTLTPETSFRIRGPGAWKERAFLRALLRTRIGREFTRAECRQLERECSFHGSMNEEKFKHEGNRYARNNRPSEELSKSFAAVLTRRYGVPLLPGLLGHAAKKRVKVLALLRRALAEAELRANPPDLLICDEFQKYRDLLLGKAAPTAEQEMMQTLLTGRGGRRTRVLLLSATPFRLYAERWREALEPAGSRELFDLLDFLGGEELAKKAENLFAKFRGSLQRFAAAKEDAAPALRLEVETLKAALEQSLCQVLCRTERPQQQVGSTFGRDKGVCEPLEAADVATFQHIARVLGANKEANNSLSRYRLDAVPYWSSVPLAAQALGKGYKAWKWAFDQGMLSEISPGPMLRQASTVGQALALRSHPKLRHLRRIHPPAASTLPWVAPSLPWWEIGKAWIKREQEEASGPPEKLLLFSRFRAAPQSIAALTSLAVEAAIHGHGAPRKKGRPLKASAKSMGTFALFHPSPWLIRNADPLGAAGGSWKDVIKGVQAQLRNALSASGVKVVTNVKRRNLWQVVAGLEKLCHMDRTIRAAWNALPSRTQGGDEDASLSIRQAVDRWQSDAADLSAVSKRELMALTLLALEAPGVVAGRALFRQDREVLAEQLPGVVSLCWHGFASYLGDPVFLNAGGARGGIQQQLREWVREGCLESVLDEHLAYAQGAPDANRQTPAALLEQSLRMHAGSASFYPVGTNAGPQSFRVSCHAAVPFGGNEHDADTSEARTSRSDELRVAFNSPFRPFLLATTSVGQEGLDFHPWCSQVAHWDLCSSPLDLEQREGRIQRYLGLGGRRQLAAKYGAEALTVASGKPHPPSPWEFILQRAESEASDDGGLSPWWVMPGAKISSHVFLMQFSRDHERYERLRMLRTLYRLALGQPNQEDFLNSLGRSSQERQQELAELMLKLAPAPQLEGMATAVVPLPPQNVLT